EFGDVSFADPAAVPNFEFVEEVVAGGGHPPRGEAAFLGPAEHRFRAFEFFPVELPNWACRRRTGESSAQHQRREQAPQENAYRLAIHRLTPSLPSAATGNGVHTIPLQCSCMTGSPVFCSMDERTTAA